MRFWILNKLPGEAGDANLPATLCVAKAHGSGLMTGVSVDFESEALLSNTGSSTFQGKLRLSQGPQLLQQELRDLLLSNTGGEMK